MLQELVTFFTENFLVFTFQGIFMEELDLKRQQIFGKHVKKLREEKGLSQDDIAARCRVTKGSLSVIENGNRNFSFTTLLALAKALEVEPKTLLDIDFELFSE